MTLKEEFIKRVKEVSNPRVITVSVELPSGAVEIITNTQHIEDKILYYMENYDGNFRLVHNPNVKIIGFMIV